MLLYYTNYRLFKNKYNSYIISAISLILLKNFITVRAQIITYIIFILEVYFLEQFVRQDKKKYLIGLIILSFGIVNVHVAVWPFFFILFLPYFVSYFKINIGKIEYRKNRGSLKLLILTFIICILIGFLTPIGLTPFTYFIKTMQGNTTKSISEHLPLNLISDLGMPIFIYIVILLFLTWFSNIKAQLKNICLAFGLTILAISSKRHMSLFYILMSFVSNQLLINIYNSFKFYLKNKKVLKIIKYYNKCFFIIIFLITLCPIFLYGKDKFTKERPNFINSSSYPIDAAKYINENLDKENIKLFNEYNYGSYLMLQNIKVFIDSRADLYTKEFNGKQDIFSDYISTSNISKSYENTFEKYTITHIILQNNSKLNMLISKDKRYAPIYKDKNFVLYSKNY